MNFLTNESFEIQPYFGLEQNLTEHNLHIIKKSFYYENTVPMLTTNGLKRYFYIETLLVTDCSVFNYHRDLLRTRNTAIILQHMRLYFTHLINLVNRRYELALKYDTDISVNVILKDILFLKVNCILNLGRNN
jgi:hypothetical protein